MREVHQSHGGGIGEVRGRMMARGGAVGRPAGTSGRFDGSVSGPKARVREFFVSIFR